ncbi:hypothetical protein [Blastochloris sulfoviridis]|uniref:Uncharacterized protein n=1 Tax=Blastochloris sulfoviridis TaxID=50712 RepID=A0A5M6I1D6_9HYPH|nr:hypothetical protein [Blastochloris sulfoviridis]KAA5602004.1 hypothetical protein F1193_07610 [Blastochloris sulfoviridis]
MNIHDVTELIWHFVGHLRLDEDVSRSRIQYEDAEAGRVLADDVDRVKDAPVRHEDPDDTDPTPVVYANFAGAQALPPFVPQFMHPNTSPVPIDPVDDIHFKTPPRVVPTPAPGSLSGALPQSIGPEYRETLFEARQINQLDDSDYFTDDLLWAGALPVANTSYMLDELYATAQDAIPAHLETVSGGGSQEAVAYATNLGSGAYEVPSSQVEAGSYHNGERLADDQTLPTDIGAIVPEMPEPTNGSTGDLGITTQAAELGANGAYNYALIADANGACGTLVVLGDKFSLNAIVQINAYSDDDVINRTGLGGYGEAGTIAGGGNHADNLAQVGFTELEAMPAAKSGTSYRIDVIEGDFFDIRTLFQSNTAADDDVATLTTEGHYCLVRTGANEMVNVSDLRDFDFTNYYDVIVVGGQYYDINAIIQLNLLCDNDAVSATGTGDGATINTGGNSLLNDAQIENYGTTNVQPLGDGMATFVSSLADGDAPDGASSWGFSDGGDGYIDVLYVTGNYFDINLLWQINAVSDVDVAALQAGSDDSATQVVSTGANELQNQAIIVDVDALSSEFIGGDVYEGSILIQANLVESDDDSVVHHDTDTLVPEVIAFTGGNDDNGPSDHAYVGPPVTMTDHIMGTVMT